MLNGKGKDRVQRKSLSLKKSKAKASTAVNPRSTGRQTDISSFFQKGILTKSNGEILEKTSSDNGDKTNGNNHSSECASSAQPKTKNANIPRKKQNASRAVEDKRDVIAMESGNETSKVIITQCCIESDEESSNPSEHYTTLKNERISSKLRAPRNHSPSGNYFQGSEFPVVGNIIPGPPSPGAYHVTPDSDVIPPTPPLVPTFPAENSTNRPPGREFLKNDVTKQASGRVSSEENRKHGSLSLKNKLKRSAMTRGETVGNVPANRKPALLVEKEKPANPFFFENGEQDDGRILDKSRLSEIFPIDLETDSSKENDCENTAVFSAPRSSLQGARKTVKLSRKSKKPKSEGGGKSFTSSARESTEMETQKDLDVLSGYAEAGVSLKSARVCTQGVPAEDGGTIFEEAGVTNGRSLKRFAEKGISPCHKRFSAMTPEATIKPRNLFKQLGQDDNSKLETSVCVTQPMSEDTEASSLSCSRNTVTTTQTEEKSASLDQTDETFDISMTSLNNDEMHELMADIQWSPLEKKTTPESQPLVSPAKNHVRRTTTELTYMTSNLTVEENTEHNSCKGISESGKHGYQRYLVLEVYRREIMDEVTAKSSTSSEKVLRLFDESNNTEKYCQLREEWERTEVEHGDIVNIIASEPSSVSTSYILDNEKENYIVVLPDILVTPTSISSSTKCLRRSVLEKHFKTEGPKEVMFLGTLMHAIFESALTSQDFSKESVLDVTKKLLRNLRHLTELYGLGITEDDIIAKVAEQATTLQDWGETFVRDEPHPIHGIINFKDGAALKSNSSDDVAVCISKVIDIEECVWSPKFGLKGQVDATVEVKINRNPNILKKNTACYETMVLPLELKTGKLYSKLGSVEHRAQVILYTLLMMDRYPHTMDSGLLLYLKTGHMLGVPAYLHEKRALVMKRNEMMRFLSRAGTRFVQNMPGMLQDQRTCNYCSQLNVCTLYHKSVEKGNSKSAGIGKLFDKMTSHLSPLHLEYFRHWNKLIVLESRAMKESGREPDIWCLSGSEREQLGYCFSKMLLVSCKPSDETDRFVNSFVKQEPEHSTARVSIADMHLTKGDYVVVGLEDGLVALTKGFLLEVSDQVVSILLDKDLTQCYHHTNSAGGQGLYRIDKAELSTGAVIQWSNLAKLFFADSDQDAKLRRLIVDLESPTFTRQKDLLSNASSSQVSDVWSSQLSACSMTSPIKSSQCSDELWTILNDLNVDQRKAITKVLTAEDYALVLGMPGTGKTTTIACLVRALVARGKSVLLTSYTHSAVDNILLKLKQSDVDFLRLGSVQKIHPEIQCYGVSNAAKDVHTVKELKEFYDSKLVVATTCLGINHTLFNQRSFDYCVVDEASQITQPVCFGSLRHASIFVLVGDHYQLPPLVQSHEAREKGMDISLFKRLSENHPQAVSYLVHQYRMHKDIMLLSNTLIYEHRLKCGTEDIAERLLDLPNWDSFRVMVSEMAKQQQVPCTWLLEVLDPHSPVIFLDTDHLPAPEVRSGHNVSNEKEAAIVTCITRALVEAGLDADSIGVISPYRHQLKVIKQHVDTAAENCGNSLSDVEISTVDKYQGRDKLCVVVSLVRCNDGGHVGDLLRDWRRVNVALTRAKQKLILVGSRKTLKRNMLFQELLSLLEDRCWVYNLQQDAWKVTFL